MFLIIQEYLQIRTCDIDIQNISNLSKQFLIEILLKGDEIIAVCYLMIFDVNRYANYNEVFFGICMQK